MSDRKRQVKPATAATAPRADEQARLNPRTQQAQATLRHYLERPGPDDPGEARELVAQSVDELIGDGLVQSAETALEHLFFLNPTLDHDTAQEYVPLYQHIAHLRRLEQAKLRHAMATLLQRPNA